MGSDGAGTSRILAPPPQDLTARDTLGVVIAAADPKDPLLNKRVFFTPMRGWLNDPDAPESDS